MSLLSITRYSTMSLALLLTIPFASADISQARWLKLNQAAVNEHILPGYQTLADKSKHLAADSASLCKAPSQTTLKQTQASFIQFWPDKKNLTSKQLNVILSAQDPAALQPEFFKTASIAVKGLPAI